PSSNWVRNNLIDYLPGEEDVSGFVNDDFITIEAGVDQEVKLASISFVASSKWRLQGLSISPFYRLNYEPQIDRVKTIVRLASHPFWGPSSKIDIVDNEIFTTDDIRSWSANDWLSKASNGIFVDASNVNIEGNLVRNTRYGIATATSKNVTVRQNQVINFSADGIRGSGDDGLFEYNVIANGFKVDDHHDDGFQSFTNARNFTPVYRVTIRNNQFFHDLNHPNKKLISDFQGIGCFDGFFNDWVIANNLLYVNHWHGITLMGANNTKVINNTVIDANPNDQLKPWIKIGPRKTALGGGSGEGNIIRNNIAQIKKHGSGITADNNLDPNSYPIESIFVDPFNKNFNLRNSPLVVDTGSKNQAPHIDIQGLARDTIPDLGAFEFTKTASER
ncbi:MAG: right-handed parallel beta-helix repeat-containing protein, partial [Acidiferrobacterales bacterium]|nr:right-handed parallel beta-helix repeat-containing protein [Acidiferrobacterales bacterium]